MSGALTVHRLGRVEPEDALAVVRLFARARREGLCGDVLLLLEPARAPVEAPHAHPAQGSREVQLPGRPGQAVGALFLAGGCDVHGVEHGLAEVLAAYGLAPEPPPARPDAWRTQRRLAVVQDAAGLGGASCVFTLDVSAAPTWGPGRSLAPDDVGPAVADALARGLGRTRVDGDITLRTVSVAVVRGEGAEAQVLVLRRRPERGGFWQVVTGRLEPGESPEAAAQRELREETGLEAPVRALDYVHAFALGDAVPPVLVQETAFGVQLPGDADVRTGPEHDAHAWLTPSEALARLPFVGLREAVLRTLRTR